MVPLTSYYYISSSTYSMVKKKSTTKKPTSPGSSLAAVPPKKTLRSQPPDVIVAVGQGNNKIEFECYKYALCCNSEYFDTMLSLPMKENETSRIDLPDKDPEEWKVFYEFIDPSTSLLAEVTYEKAMLMAPWFHEYQMDVLLAKCDDILHHKIVSDDNDLKIGNLKTLLDTCDFCDSFSLKQSLEKAIVEISIFVMNAFRLLKYHQEILKRVFNVYKDHKDIMLELLCDQTKILFIEIEENESADGEDIWENKYFQYMIENKLEVMALKQKYEYKNLGSGFGDVKGSVVVKGAGLDVVNGIYFRHSKKRDSVSQFTKPGFFQNAPCQFNLFRYRSEKWFIEIVKNRTLVTFPYCCDSNGAVNEVPHGYKWTKSEGIDPPPTVEYQSQLSSLDDNISSIHSDDSSSIHSDGISSILFDDSSSSSSSSN